MLSYQITCAPTARSIHIDGNQNLGVCAKKKKKKPKPTSRVYFNDAERITREFSVRKPTAQDDHWEFHKRIFDVFGVGD